MTKRTKTAWRWRAAALLALAALGIGAAAALALVKVYSNDFSSAAKADQLTIEGKGCRKSWDKENKQFAHASGIVLVTPQGRIAKYFYGVEFSARDLRLAIVEASANQIGTFVDQLLLFCFHYDPATGRYSRLALDVVRAGGVLTLAAMAGMIGWWLRRERLGRAAA